MLAAEYAETNRERLWRAPALATAIATDPNLLAGWSSGLDKLDAKRAAPMRVIVVLGDPRLIEGPSTHRTAPTMHQTVEEEIPEGAWQVIRKAEPRVLFSTKGLSLATLRKLEARADVEAVICEGALWELLDDNSGGTFHFSQRWVNDAYEPGRYTREGEPPKDPLKLSDLAMAEQEHVSALRLPIRFAETEQL